MEVIGIIKKDRSLNIDHSKSYVIRIHGIIYQFDGVWRMDIRKNYISLTLVMAEVSIGFKGGIY